MAFAEKSDENQLNGFRLAHDNLVHILEEPFRGVLDLPYSLSRKGNRLIHIRLPFPIIFSKPS
jgi:hypothetical protein